MFDFAFGPDHIDATVPMLAEQQLKSDRPVPVKRLRTERPRFLPVDEVLNDLMENEHLQACIHRRSAAEAA